ncbi:hypothetical protein D3C77_467240 [compost metagenome]
MVDVVCGLLDVIVEELNILLELVFAQLGELLDLQLVSVGLSLNPCLASRGLAFILIDHALRFLQVLIQAATGEVMDKFL